jgi:serine/threonine protein kinase/Flp pilus assembly protein TadD
MTAASNPATGSGTEDRAEGATVRRWGKFELRERVGRGSFGEVYRAWDPDLEREVGLKILVPRAAQVQPAFEDVLGEARALASVRHPNILAVYGVDQHDGRVGFWTDFVRGKTLRTLVTEQGPFGYQEAVLIGLDVCKALSAVHRAGLLHRDVKAENVMREEGGRILLMDFGLSALGGQQKDFAGTPRYMAPELLRGESATVMSDLYAVGVLLFFLVTGQYSGETAPAVRQAENDGADAPTATHVTTAVTHRGTARGSVLDHRPDLPDAFVRTVETAMHPDPWKRFASAGALSSALAETLGAAPAAAAHPGPKRRAKWIAGAAVALVLLAGAMTYRVRSGEWFPGEHRTAATEAVPPNLNDEFLKADKLLERYDIRKNVTEAMDLLKKVLAQDPSFALAQAGLGRGYFLEYRVTREAGLLDQARVACNKAMALDGSLSQPYTTLARIDAMAGHTDLAMQEAQKALRLDPRSAEAYGAQAEVFDAEGRGDDAAAAVEKAIDLQPDYWRWPLLLGNYDYAAGKLQEAATEYRKAEAIAPDSPIVQLNLGLVALQLGNYAEAQAHLEKSVQMEPSFKAYSTLSEVFDAQGKYEDAIEMSRKARDLNPTNYVAWGNLGAAYINVPSDHPQAVEAYRKAIELAEVARKETPNDSFLLAELGSYYAYIGDADRSLPLLRQAVTLAPEDPSVLFSAGDGYEILHRRSEAIPLIAQSIALGFHANQLERSPDLAALRADPKFQSAVKGALAQQQTGHQP